MGGAFEIPEVKTTVRPASAYGRGDIDETYNKGLCDLAPRPESRCFMTAQQRADHIDKFHKRVMDVAKNYRDALQELRIETLLEKESDLSWIVSLVLDLATGHLSSVVGAALQRVNAGGAARDATNHTRELILSDGMIDKTIKGPIDAAKKTLTNELKSVQNQKVRSKKAEKVAHLEQVRDSADVAFAALREKAPALADDAELLALVDGMRIEVHSVGHYKQALQAKLARYQKSGVPQIGQRAVTLPHHGLQPVRRDRRVIWVTNRMAGAQRQLWFEKQDFFSHPVLGPTPDGSSLGFSRVDDAPVLETPVPSEFVDAALARHESSWGAPPDELEIDRAGKVTRRPGTPVASTERAMYDIFFGADEETA